MTGLPRPDAGEEGGSHAYVDPQLSARLAHFEENDKTESARTFTRISHAVTAFGLVTCIGFVIYGFFSGIFDSVASLRAFLDGMGIWAPVGFILLSAAQSVFPILPGGITVIAAPVLFGVVKGSIYSYLGAVLGSFAAFAISRQLGMAVLRARFNAKTLNKYLGWLTHPRFPHFFALAIALPVAPDDFLCYLAGLTNMKKRVFAAIIIFLKPWSILAYSFGVLTLLKMLLPSWGF